jgi:hypothetical protein
MAYGEPISCDIERGATDTDDIILNIKKDGAAIDVTGWTADIKINDAKDGSGTTHFTATGAVLGTPTDGQIAIDMSLFDGTTFTGKKFYDIRVSDAASGGRDYITGSIKIVQRID